MMTIVAPQSFGQIVCYRCGRTRNMPSGRWLCMTCAGDDRREIDRLLCPGRRTDRFELQLRVEPGEAVSPHWAGYGAEVLSLSLGDKEPPPPPEFIWPWVYKFADEPDFRAIIRWRAYKPGERGCLDLTWGGYRTKQVITMIGFQSDEVARCMKFLDLLRNKGKTGPKSRRRWKSKEHLERDLDRATRWYWNDMDEPLLEITAAARALGVHADTLRDSIRDFGVQFPRNRLEIS